MANITPNTSDSFGRAAFEQLDTFLTGFLLSGTEPPLTPAMRGYPQAINTTLPQYAVVGISGTGKVVLATDAIAAIGVLPHASVAGATVDAVTPEIWYSGCFDPDALVWDATLNTDAERLAAFRGAPSPTQILIRKRSGL